MPASAWYALVGTQVPAAAVVILRQQIADLERYERVLSGRPAALVAAVMGWTARADEAERLAAALVALARRDLPQRWRGRAAGAFTTLLRQAAEESRAVAARIRRPGSGPGSGGSSIMVARQDTVIEILMSIKMALDRAQITLTDVSTRYETWLRAYVAAVSADPSEELIRAVADGRVAVTDAQTAEAALRQELEISRIRLEAMATAIGTLPENGAFASLAVIAAPRSMARWLADDIGLNGRFPRDGVRVRSGLERLAPVLERILQARITRTAPDPADRQLIVELQGAVFGDPGTAIGQLRSFIRDGDIGPSPYSAGVQDRLIRAVDQLAPLLVLPGPEPR